MNILLISYGDIDYDGRLRSLCNVFSKLGKVYAFTRGSSPINTNSKVCNSPYPIFILGAVRFAKNVNNTELLLLDNRKATIPGIIIKKIIHPKITIQDCRELYLIDEVKSIVSKIGCFFEMIMVKKADIVICANKERAKIMGDLYGLNVEPFSYENLRQLQYQSKDEIDEAEKKFKPYMYEGEIRIVSSSGCSVTRTNDVLVDSMSKLDLPCRLFLVGDSTSKDIGVIKKIIDEKQLNNVEVLGRLSQAELKYLISHSHIGIVNYGQYDTNNRLCASGKLYEFLYEGIPVVTTTNPPLKRICENSGIGVADDDYYEGIRTVISRYDEFKQNIKVFIENNSIAANDEAILHELSSFICGDN